MGIGPDLLTYGQLSVQPPSRADSRSPTPVGPYPRTAALLPSRLQGEAELTLARAIRARAGARAHASIDPQRNGAPCVPRLRR
ncbi:hypothetical protein GCM10027615_37370 [Plantactinospora veratri]